MPQNQTMVVMMNMQMKDKRNDRKFWSEAEVKFLEKNFMKMDNQQLGDVLGRTKAGVEVKLSKLNMKRPAHKNFLLRETRHMNSFFQIIGRMDTRLEVAMDILK
ncbi:MAG: hypothetical protein ACEQSL_03755 [Sediminibacterium sp.]